MKTSVKLTFQDYLEYDDNTNRLYKLVDRELKLMTPASPLHSDIIDFSFKLFYRESEYEFNYFTDNQTIVSETFYHLKLTA